MLENVVRTGLSVGLLAFAVNFVPALTCWASALGSLLIAAHTVKITSGILRSVLPRRRVSSHNKAVFVTGCDTGFGHYLVERLDKYGFEVFAGCLSPTGEGALKLKTSCSPNVHIVKLDVSNTDDVRAAVKYVREQLGGKELWALVNNAGVLLVADLEWQNVDRLRRLFEVNTFGMVRMTQAFLPMLRRSKGHVVNVNSMAGRVAATKIGAYSMSKAAGVFFCDALRVEMMTWGVKVSSIEPWVYKTSMSDYGNYCCHADSEWKAAGVEVKEDYGEEYFRAFKESLSNLLDSGSDKVHEVVDSMVEAVTAKEPEDSYNPGPLLCKVGHWLGTLFPSYFANLFQYMAGPADRPKALTPEKLKSF